MDPEKDENATFPITGALEGDTTQHSDEAVNPVRAPTRDAWADAHSEIVGAAVGTARTLLRAEIPQCEALVKHRHSKGFRARDTMWAILGRVDRMLATSAGAVSVNVEMELLKLRRRIGTRYTLYCTLFGIFSGTVGFIMGVHF